MKLAANRINSDGMLIIDARNQRSQSQNRRDAIDRLVELIRRAAIAPKVRRPTAPTRASRQRRVEGKKHRSKTKHFRRNAAEE